MNARRKVCCPLQEKNKKTKQAQVWLGTQASQVAFALFQPAGTSKCKTSLPKKMAQGICTCFHGNPTSLKSVVPVQAGSVVYVLSGQVPRWNQVTNRESDIGKQVILPQPRYLHSASTLHIQRKIRIGIAATSRRNTEDSIVVVLSLVLLSVAHWVVASRVWLFCGRHGLQPIRFLCIGSRWFLKSWILKGFAFLYLSTFECNLPT